MKPFTKGALISALRWVPVGVVREFLDGKEWGFPIYVVEDEVPDGLANETIPYTLIVDPEGTIRFEHKGSGNYDTDLARVRIPQGANRRSRSATRSAARTRP